MKRLEDLKKGLEVINDKLEEKIAFLCGKTGIDMDDPMLVSDGTPDAEAEGGEENAEGNAEGGAEGEAPAEGADVAAGAEGAAPQGGAVDPNAAAAGAAPDAAAMGGAVDPNAAAAAGAAPAPDAAADPNAAAAAAQPTDQAQQQPVQEAEETNPVAAAIGNVIKTPEDAAKMLQGLKESMSESAKRKFIKACAVDIKENVEEYQGIEESKQNALIKKYIKSFKKGYDELTESEDEVEVTEAELDQYINEMDTDHLERVFEDFCDECGLEPEQIKEHFGDSEENDSEFNNQLNNFDQFAAKYSNDDNDGDYRGNGGFYGDSRDDEDTLEVAENSEFEA